MIEEFEFPEKCVLLLGREKDGIPIDLIQVRSLDSRCWMDALKFHNMGSSDH